LKCGHIPYFTFGVSLFGEHFLSNLLRAVEHIRRADEIRKRAVLY